MTINHGRGFPAVSAWLVIAVFMGIIVGTALIDSLFPVPLPLLTGIEQKQEERRVRNARIMDGTRARLIEHHQRLRSRVRATVSPEYSFALHRWFHEVKPSIIRGKDGWLFLRNRILPARQPDADDLVSIADNISLLSRRCSRAGSRLILLPVPRKAVLCAEYLPDWVRADLSIDSVFISLLRKRNVRVVDMFDILRSETDRPPYYKRGSHWTQITQIRVAEKLCETAGMLAPSEYRTTEIVDSGQRTEEFSLLQYAGILTNQRIETILRRTTAPHFRVVKKDDTANIRGAPQTGEAAYLFGTSFSAGTFHRFVRHFSRYAIRNMAHRGTNPFAHFGQFLTELKTSRETNSLPGIIIIEFPVHQLFESLEKEFSVIRHLLPHDEFEYRVPVDLTIEPSFKDERVLSVHPARCATVVTDSRTFPDSASVVIRVFGELTGGDAILVARSASHRYKTRWKRGNAAVVLPVAGKSIEDRVVFSIRSLRGSAGTVHARIDDIQLLPAPTPESMRISQFTDSEEEDKLRITPAEFLYGYHMAD